MADVVAYQQWLKSLQRQPAFINNYWSAMLAFDMEDNKHSDGFNIPYYIVEEELMKEDNNVILTNREDAYASAALRHWLVQLLKPYDEGTNALNFEEKLRHFLTARKVLPPAISHPLANDTLFHNLPAECKVWIFYKLRTYKRTSSTLSTIAKDPMGNSYYLVGDCLLYAHFARPDKTALPIDEAKLKGKPWEALYRFLYTERCVILCQDQQGWNVVFQAMLMFKLTNLLDSIRPEIMVKTTEQNAFMLTRDRQRREFEEELSKLAPIPRADIWEKLTKQQKKKLSSENAGKNHVNILKKEFETMSVKAPPTPALTTPTQAVPINKAKPAAIRKDPDAYGKCWKFPQCLNPNWCYYVHPKERCQEFPNCPNGWECLLLHDPCPNDGYCEEPNCAYEHWQSLPTYYRIPREEAPAPRPVASVAPMMRKVSDQNTNQTTEQPLAKATPPPAAQQPNNAVQGKKKKRCQYFPKCARDHKNDYIHPTIKCKKLLAGEKCAGRVCLFLHGPCPKDGSCEDMKCIYEHYKSLPVIERTPANKQKEGSLCRAPSMGNLSRVNSMGNLSRCSSMGNLSTCSGRSRKKSVTWADVDSDDDFAPSKKDSDSKKPAGILRPSPNANSANAAVRCRFGSQCKNKRTCEFAHPTKKCADFPKCPKGGACLFLHEVCENDGVCVKQNCDFEHEHPHEIDNSWCNNGSVCKKVGCKFLHPQECIGRCPTPDDCWKYHRPGAAAAAAASPQGPTPPAPGYGPGPFPGPGYWPNAGFPGYGQMPPFGYGPQFGYPNFPPGAGYGGGPAMGYGGYGPHPGYPQGYGGYGGGPGVGAGGGFGPQPGYDRVPGYGPGPGGYPTDAGRPQGGNGGNAPPVPPRRITSGDPPPYEPTAGDDLQQIKRGIESTRF